MNDLETIDIREKSRARDGQEQLLDRRLFMQLLAFGDGRNTAVLIKALEQANIPGALYADINDPSGVALVTVSESPDFFVTEMRAFLGKRPFADLTPKPELTMLGRTYAIGYEPDLEEAVINRPRRRVFDPNLKWGIWYPLSTIIQRMRKTKQTSQYLAHLGPFFTGKVIWQNRDKD